MDSDKIEEKNRDDGSENEGIYTPNSKILESGIKPIPLM
jgi:hypothetical protein